MEGLLLTILDMTKQDNMLLFVCSEAVESKLETSLTPPMVSVLWLHHGAL